MFAHTHVLLGMTASKGEVLLISVSGLACYFGVAYEPHDSRTLYFSSRIMALSVGKNLIVAKDLKRNQPWNCGSAVIVMKS